MRNADFGIDDWQISLCRGDGYEIFACTLYIQTASYPAMPTKSMSSKPSFAGVKVMKYLHVPYTFKLRHTQQGRKGKSLEVWKEFLVPLTPFICYQSI